MKFFLSLALAVSIPAALANMDTNNKRYLRSLAASCEICSPYNKVRPQSLTLQYIAQGVNSLYQDTSKASCVAGTYPTATTLRVKDKSGSVMALYSQITNGDVFTIPGEFDSATTMVYSTGNCFIHTSCSVPLVAGDQIGPFKVLAGNNCYLDQYGGFEVIEPNSDQYSEGASCEICSSNNKVKPASLTFQYVPQGVDSNYQDSKKASCDGSKTYPEQTTLTVKDKSGTTMARFNNLTNGVAFAIPGPFDSETTMVYNGGSCYVHTSCSAPLITGDQIGAFRVLGGNNCAVNGVNVTASDELVPSSGGGAGTTCEICSKNNKVKPSALTFEYNPQGMNSQYQDSSKASCDASINYPTVTGINVKDKGGDTMASFTNITTGSIFTVPGPFDSATTMVYNGGNCFVHTSCSVPLVAGDQIGAFKVLAGNNCQIGGNPTVTLVPPSSCEICSPSNKVKPSALTFMYNPQGATSLYQDSSKASCDASKNYPATTTLTVKDKSGNVMATFSGITAGSVFTIPGPFDSATTMVYGSGNCFVHTSCSAPLVTGDQIGAFVVLAGNNCDYNPSATTTTPGGIVTTAQPQTNCEICSPSNKVKPSEITFMYNPQGMNSMFQDSSKASCDASKSYPVTTTVTVKNNSGQVVAQFNDVVAGAIFTVPGPFDSATTFVYNGGNCFVHTSCSAPLVTGDQIGAFRVLAGNSCEYTPAAGGDPGDIVTTTTTPAGAANLGCISGNVKEDLDNNNTGDVPLSGVLIALKDMNGSTIGTTLTDSNGNYSFCGLNGGSYTVTETNPSGVTDVSDIDGGDPNEIAITLPNGQNSTGNSFVDEQLPGATTTTTPGGAATTSSNCEVCSPNNNVKPDSLTFVYNPQGVDSMYQGSDKATCDAGAYPATTTLIVKDKDGNLIIAFEDITAGSMFTVPGPLGGKTTFDYEGGNCYITTSCSVPIVVGDQLGPFKVVGGNDCVEPSNPQGGANPVCEVCSMNDMTPPTTIVFLYNSDSKTSDYQDITSASCVEGTYPSSTTLIISKPGGVIESIPVQSGQPFELVGPYNDKTTFQFSGTSTSCFIDLSCSVPLIAGDQLGPFVVVEGKDCVYTTPAPTMSVSPSEPPSPVPSSSPTKKPTTSPTSAPSVSQAPTLTPTRRPTFPPTPRPTQAPSESPSLSLAPTESPTNGPTTSPSDRPSRTPSESPTASPAPTRAPCIKVMNGGGTNGDEFELGVGNTVEISYNVDIIPIHGLVCIYPCTATLYYESELWQCGTAPPNCQPVNSSGQMTFYTSIKDVCDDPSISDIYPVAPSLNPDGSINTCFKAVAVRGVTPFGDICETDPFTVTENPSCV